uniref:LacI family transcriptional regulator n=1 Tax=Thermodesulfobacterium geofontis TaxID=1295609 RepID=A0A7V6CDG5_9BACT
MKQVIKNTNYIPRGIDEVTYSLRFTIFIGEFSQNPIRKKSGKKLTEKLLKLPNPPNALFTGNNLLTLGALETIYKFNLKIPNDIAIIGFDDPQRHTNANKVGKNSF